MVLFVDDNSKKLYLTSGCVYSLQYLCSLLSGCSGAGDFFRSLFEFCRRLQVLLADPESPFGISLHKLGLLLALTVFSPSPSLKLNVEMVQKQLLNTLNQELGPDAVSSILESLSSLKSLSNKHERMVLSIRDNADIDLAVDLHAELLQLPPK